MRTPHAYPLIFNPRHLSHAVVGFPIDSIVYTNFVDVKFVVEPVEKYLVVDVSEAG